MGSNPVILAIDTSAAHCAAALLVGEAVVAVKAEEMTRGQAERLMPLAEEVLAEAGLTARDLTAVAVGVGPGNFTGIRISVSAARGLALALKVPAIGVSNLEALAEGRALPFTARLDARRGMVYVQSFDADGVSAPEMAGAAQVGEPMPLPEAETLITIIAQIAARKLATGAVLARPAPMYIRAADAAPPRDPAPVILS